MAKYCVYCYNGIHKTYYRTSNDFILTKDYRKCAICERQRRLVIMPLFANFDCSDILSCHARRIEGPLNAIFSLPFLPLQIIVWAYKKTKANKKDIH